MIFIYQDNFDYYIRNEYIGNGKLVDDTIIINMISPCTDHENYLLHYIKHFYKDRVLFHVSPNIIPKCWYIVHSENDIDIENIKCKENINRERIFMLNHK
jgi:hypothetical protein